MGKHKLSGNMPLRTLGKEMAARSAAISAVFSGRDITLGTGRHAAIPTPAQRAVVIQTIIKKS